MSGNARLGIFILVALGAFAAMIFWIGDRQTLFTRTYHISAPFDSVAGLEEGAPVRTGGVRIGVVERIQLPPHPEDRISVELRLQNATRNVIKKDSIASIETEGLLGSKYVALSFGSPEGEQLSEGDTIDSRPTLDYSDVAKRAGEMLQSAKEAIDSSQVAIGNVNQATDDLKSITGKIDGGKGTIGALLNDRSLYQSLNATVAQANAGATSFQENMEALKHNFFLRGFFNKRGYFDSSELSKNTVAKVPRGTPARQFTFDEKELFDKPTTAKLRKEKLLNQVGALLESNPVGLAVIVAKTGSKGTKDENLKLSQARAMVVRQYLVKNFKVDDSRIKTLGAGEAQQAVDGGGGLTVMIYSPGRDDRMIAAKNK